MLTESAFEASIRAPSIWSAFVGDLACFVESVMALMERGLEGFFKEGMFGMAGTTGARRLVGVFAVWSPDSTWGLGVGAMADDGVVGWVESASDAASEVAGVNELVESTRVDGASFSSDGVGSKGNSGWGGSLRGCSRCWSVSCMACSSTTGSTFLVGSSSRASEVRGGLGRLRRLLGSLGGKLDSATEYQGN